MNYHICIIHPKENFFYGLIFKEITLLLLHSLNDLGITCTLKINQINKNSINLFLGTIHLNYDNIPRDIKYIPYQLEQLSTDEGWYKELFGMHNFLQNAEQIWDYSLTNIDFLQSKNIQAKYLPIGYHSALEIIPTAEKNIDILFYGSINERRTKILDKLIAKGLKVTTLSSLLGKQRDEYIARAKIVLNIHYYDMKIFESPRITYLLNNKVFVITENSTDNPYPKIDLVSVPYEQLVEECIKRLADWENSQKIAELNYRQFKENYPMVEFLKKVI